MIKINNWNLKNDWIASEKTSGIFYLEKEGNGIYNIIGNKKDLRKGLII